MGAILAKNEGDEKLSFFDKRVRPGDPSETQDGCPVGISGTRRYRNHPNRRWEPPGAS